MKNRLTITVSDVNGSKSYNVNKIIKKVVLWTIFAVIVFVTLSFYIIRELNDSVTQLSNERESLKIQNDLYSKDIESKRNHIQELGNHLEDIEEIIGIDKDDTSSLIQRATLAKISSTEKIYMQETIPSGCPLKECITTSKFGYRKHPVTRKKSFHKGIDLRAKRKTDVMVTADGVVRYAKTKNEGTFGRVVIVSHNFGFETVYSHLRYVDVKVGDVVKKGQVIARSGNSGRSNGPHLHYEVRYASKVLNPDTFIKWDMKNYNKLFEKERRVQWESLVNLIKNQNPSAVQR